MGASADHAEFADRLVLGRTDNSARRRSRPGFGLNLQ